MGRDMDWIVREGQTFSLHNQTFRFVPLWTFRFVHLWTCEPSYLLGYAQNELPSFLSPWCLMRIHFRNGLSHPHTPSKPGSGLSPRLMSANDVIPAHLRHDAQPGTHYVTYNATHSNIVCRRTPDWHSVSPNGNTEPYGHTFFGSLPCLHNLLIGWNCRIPEEFNWARFII